MLDYRFDEKTRGWKPEKCRELLELLTEELPDAVRVVDYGATAAEGRSVRIILDEPEDADKIIKKAEKIYRRVMKIGPRLVS